ncbi:MAG: histidine--tRNA ligase [Polyangiales bacterium]
MGDKKRLIKPRTPPGTMELLPKEQVALQRMMDTIRAGYERFGFVPIETPAFETTDVLLTKSGGETEKQVYFVQSTGARQQGKDPDLALRFDLTVPLARYVAEHEHELTFPFRRYQIQRVYRGERAQKGRFREFYQCDIDVIGKGSLPLRYDAEMPAVIHHVFSELDMGPFTIRLNNRKLLRGVLDWLGLAGGDQHTLALREVDKLEKAGRDGVIEGLGKVGLDRRTAERMLDTLVRKDDNAATVRALRASGVDDALFTEGLSEIEQVLADLSALGVPDGDVQLDPTIARGLDYYTGTVYETVLDDHPDIGSVCSGGRYDDLAGLYTKSELPGVGISIGLTRLFYQLREAGLVRAEDSSVQVLVTQLDDALARDYLELASELRAGGLNTELYPEASKLGKQMKHADRAGIRFAVVMGEDEKNAGTVTLKDMRSGEQHSVPRRDVAARVLEILAG